MDWLAGLGARIPSELLTNSQRVSSDTGLADPWRGSLPSLMSVAFPVGIFPSLISSCPRCFLGALPKRPACRKSLSLDLLLWDPVPLIPRPIPQAVQREKTSQGPHTEIPERAPGTLWKAPRWELLSPHSLPPHVLTYPPRAQNRLGLVLV